MQQFSPNLFIKGQFNTSYNFLTRHVTVMYLSGSSTSAGKVYNVLSSVLEIITLRLLRSPLPRGRQSGVGLIFDTVPPMLSNIIIYSAVFGPRKLCRSNSVRTESDGDRSHKAMSRWRHFPLRSGGLTVFKAVILATEGTERSPTDVGHDGYRRLLAYSCIHFQLILAYVNQPKALFACEG